MSMDAIKIFQNPEHSSNWLIAYSKKIVLKYEVAFHLFILEIK